MNRKFAFEYNARQNTPSLFAREAAATKKQSRNDIGVFMPNKYPQFFPGLQATNMGFLARNDQFVCSLRRP
jgi:hypothetical protein